MDHTKPLFQTLQELLQEEGSVSVQELLEKAGDQTFGFAIVLFSVFTYLPAISTLSALACLLLGWQMCRSHPHPWIPKRIADLQLHQGHTKQRLATLESYMRRLGPRPLIGRPLSHRWTGLAVLWTAFLAALPLPIIPFANVLPAAGLTLLGMALLEERPALAWLGVTISLVTTVYFIMSSGAVFFAIHKGINYLHWLREG